MMQITIRNRWLLRLFGFYPVSPTTPMRVEQPLGLWLRCLWWRLSGRFDRERS